MKKLNIILCVMFMASLSWANNVTTSAISIGGQNVTSHFTKIKYSITWENSWRTGNNENNYDGCWIFAKFRKKNASAWQHATINYVSPGTATACGHTEPAGSTIQTAADGKGVWMYRNAVGSGTVTWTDAELRWNYGVDGVADNDSVEIKLFAVEMVYVPQGSFLLGSNGTETYHLQRGDKDTCFKVTSENAITVGTTSTTLSANPSWAITSGTIPAAYPKGFKAVWCMKYEISRQQYVDFLNLLDASTMALRRPAGFGTGTHPALAVTNPERAMGSVNMDDILSLLDWSALRPMTEMEFEKICRGSNQVPIPNEFAWGNTTITSVITPSNQGAANETWASGNVAFDLTAPMRCGALATATSTRTSSGGTYYGVMEMTGNVSEIVVSLGYPASVAFNGSHGDGTISASAQSYNVPNWDAVSSGMYGYKGGGYTSSSAAPGIGSISDRLYYSYTSNGSNGDFGGRGVRTAE